MDNMSIFIAVSIVTNKNTTTVYATSPHLMPSLLSRAWYIDYTRGYSNPYLRVRALVAA
jgi:hypothetical protein